MSENGESVLMKELRKSRSKISKLEKKKEEEYKNFQNLVLMAIKHGVKQVTIAKHGKITPGRVHQIKIGE